MQQLKTCFVGELNDREYEASVKSFIKHALFAGICILLVNFFVYTSKVTITAARHPFKCEYVTKYGCLSKCGCAWSQDFTKCVSLVVPTTLINSTGITSIWPQNVILALFTRYSIY